MVGFNFAAQKRAVTINDYNSLLDTMPSKFGAPAKAAITEQDNKIIIQVLSFDNEGKLTESISNTLKQNIANYLSNYRMINDYIQVTNGQVIDLEFEFSIVTDSTQNQGQVITNIVNSVNSYFSPLTSFMGKNVNISEVRRIVQDVAGVINLTEIKVFNKTGGQYSSSQTSQTFSNLETKQILLVDDTIFAQPNQIYQIRFPQRDIKVRIKNLSTVDFS
jgi:hypothetical protein